MESIEHGLENILKKNSSNKVNYKTEYSKLVEKILKDRKIADFIKKNQIPNEEVMHSLAKLYEYKNECDKYIKDKNSIKYVPNLEYENGSILVIYKPTLEYSKFLEKEKLKNLVYTLGISKSTKNASFKNYDMPSENTKSGLIRQNLLGQALEFTTEYSENPHKFYKGMYLYGSFGVGKTYLLAAIANELAQEGCESMLIHFPSFIVDVKNSINDNRTADVIRDVKQKPILMIDDIGADQISSWIRDEVLGVILQYRMQEELPTFFSSNLSMHTLETQYLSINNKNEKEPLKAKRIMERIRYLAKEYEIIGENRRNLKN